MKDTISHIYKNSSGLWVIQNNADHLNGVAALASEFAGEFGMAAFGKVLGMLHDKGKESKAFQQHIKKESGYDSGVKVEGNYNHAYIGGILAREIYGKLSDNIFVNQIISHHVGLYDSDEIEEVVNNDIPLGVDTNIEKEKLNMPKFKTQENDLHHLARILYSCLVDADYLDTEFFMDKVSSQLRKNKSTLETLLPLLEKKLDEFRINAIRSNVNVIRNKIQQQCAAMSNSPIGIYSLTVPTGGGKTLASLLWAMKHAVRNGQKRIIVAIPYTSIIMQTAATLRNIFGEENVLEHHSNVEPEQIKDEKLREKMKLATENWDYPIIVTTNVQLFESMFSNKPSVCRKLHNIVNSVIVLDEVQTLPVWYLQPIVDSLKTYNRLFRVSVLLTTASQPVLSGLIEGCNPKVSFTGIDNITEIIPSDFNLHDKLRRVQLDINNEGETYDEIAEMLCKHKKVLCVVNTRKDARELYERLPQEGITLHLSKMMCPAHISETIKKLKTALKDGKNDIVRVVSTQLIEAGVDIDFPVVYRQEAGLDSILQAAGRCNREGKDRLGITYVFSLAKEHCLPRGSIMQTANSARLNLGKDLDWFAPETMTSYFQQFYGNQNSFDKKGIKECLYDKEDMHFKKAAKKFKIIENAGTNVVVCWENSMDLVQQLQEYGPSYMLMKNLSKYMVNINKEDFKVLLDMGVVSEKQEGLFVIEYKRQYDAHIGLRIDNNWTNEVLTI